MEVYANFPDRPLSAADADELNRLREKTCGSEGAAKDRQAAKRLLRKRSEAAQPEARSRRRSRSLNRNRPSRRRTRGEPVVPQGPSAADLRAERLRVARERQDALRKQMDAEPRAPVVDPEPEAPRAAEVLGIPTDGTPEQIAAAALRIVEQHGLPPPTKRASVESKCESPTTRRRPIAARDGGRPRRRRRDAAPPALRGQEIDDVVLPSLKPTDLVDLGVSPGACLAILGPSAGKAKKIEASAEAILHDVATHQSVLEDELRHHRAEIERLRISRDELPEDLCCPITCELMKDPVITADGTTFERCAIAEWRGGGGDYWWPARVHHQRGKLREPHARTEPRWRQATHQLGRMEEPGVCPPRSGNSPPAGPLLTKMCLACAGRVAAASGKKGFPALPQRCEKPRDRDSAGQRHREPQTRLPCVRKCGSSHSTPNKRRAPPSVSRGRPGRVSWGPRFGWDASAGTVIKQCAESEQPILFA